MLLKFAALVLTFSALYLGVNYVKENRAEKHSAAQVDVFAANEESLSQILPVENMF